MSAIVVAVAGYHYWRIFESWGAAFNLENGTYVPSGIPFNDGYRYVDWLLTVPLLVAELVAVLALAHAKSVSLTAKLVIAAVLMIALGYPGEIATDMTARAFWGALSTIPFIYILWVLWVELGRAVERESSQVKILLRNTRLLLLATWGFYPITYMLPMFGIVGATALVGVQVGYSIADVAAKCGYGLMIYAIARAKTQADQAAQGDGMAKALAFSPVTSSKTKVANPAVRQG
jgi:bacteriorhodopsin